MTTAQPFFPQNCEFISCNSEFTFHLFFYNSKFTFCNSEFFGPKVYISQLCVFCCCFVYNKIKNKN